MSERFFTGSDVERAYDRVKNDLHRTPIFTSAILDAIINKKLYFKCEAFQKTGSFKSRGALNAVKCALEKDPQLHGVVTHSSGNFGQALAWACDVAGIENCITVVPRNAPIVKKEAMRHYGAQIFECDASERKAECERLSKEYKFPIIEPFDDFDIMAGQGTLAVELLKQVDKLDAILVSTGGGGLVSGVAVYVKHASPDVKVFCVEPEGKELNQQLEQKEANKDNAHPLFTIADGVRVHFIGSKCFDVVKRYCEPVALTVNDAEIKEATKLIWQYLKVVAEPSAALPLAAALKYGNTELSNCKRIGLILCGGNFDVNNIFQ